MKNARVFMMLFSVALIMGTIILGACKAQESTNYLKIKGNVMNEQKANITIYKENDNGEWVIVKEIKNRSKYSLRLSTSSNYHVIFSNTDNDTKLINIKSGDPGMYLEYVDINFDSKITRAYMYQYYDRYLFSTEEYCSIAKLE